jgi:hypothetical protein
MVDRSLAVGCDQLHTQQQIVPRQARNLPTVGGVGGVGGYGKFWDRVDFRGPNGCWLIPTIRKDGYCYVKYMGRNVTAHRAAWEDVVGPIPAGMELDHKCRVRNCVNPAHLEPMTHYENIMKGNTVAAMRVAQTHCIHGHPLFGENLYLDPNGYRFCRTCRKRWRSEYQERKKNAQ